MQEGGVYSVWCEGASLRNVSTNNLVESKHNRFKEDDLDRKKMPLATFLPKALEFVQTWSDRLEVYPDYSFRTTATVGHPVQVAAWQWVLKKIRFICATDLMFGLQEELQHHFCLPTLPSAAYFVPDEHFAQKTLFPVDDGEFAQYLMDIAVVDKIHSFKRDLSARFNVHIVLAYEDED